MNDIDISYKYAPLFDLLNGDHKEVDTVIITGGRGSAKSYTVGLFSITALTEYDYNILYTRFTNTSIVDSIKPEVSDKLDILNKRHLVNDTNTHIEFGKNRIAFKGIKTGSKQQTSNLKSLSNFNVFVNDEAEELPDYATFKKVFYSIRSNTKRNITILILNPSSITHWIYKELFKKRGVAGGSNCIKGNVMYIHTSYLDVNPKYIAENIRRDYERMRIEDPEQYENVVLGGWLKNNEGLVFKNVNWIKSFPKDDQLDRVFFGMDYGFENDPTALVKIGVSGQNVYAQKLVYKPIDNSNDMYKAVGHHIGDLRCWTDIHPITNDLRNLGIAHIYAAKKFQGCIKYRVSILKKYNIYFVEDEDVEIEQQNYKYQQIEGEWTDEPDPKSKFNHFFDALGYACQHELR